MLFNVYDANSSNSLLDDCSIDIEAKTAREALQQYLKNQNQGNIKFRNTAGNDVIWRTKPIYIRDGKRYLAGRVSWWGLSPKRMD